MREFVRGAIVMTTALHIGPYISGGCDSSRGCMEPHSEGVHGRARHKGFFTLDRFVVVGACSRTDRASSVA